MLWCKGYITRILARLSREVFAILSHHNLRTTFANGQAYLAARAHAQQLERTTARHRTLRAKQLARRPYTQEKGPGYPEPFMHSMAGCKGLEPSTSDVTGRRSNQLS